MKLFIPACGDRIVLASPWTFTLYNESRNHAFAESLGIRKKDSNRWIDYGQPFKDVTLPAGTVLECDRVYIRIFSKSAKAVEDDYDSITWRIVGQKKSRFWAKLSDCNTIEFELQKDSSFKERARLEEELAKTTPQRLNAEAIREMLYTAWCRDDDTVIRPLITRVRHKAEAWFPESEKLYNESYEAYREHKTKEHERLRSENSETWRHRFAFSSHTFHIDALKPLSKEAFMNSFLTAERANCAFSKQPDGYCRRKFWWPRPESPPQYWSYDTESYALQGLFLVIISDSSDTQVVGVEVCDKRMASTKKPR